MSNILSKAIATLKRISTGFNSNQYWKNRYKEGRDSGEGSYGIYYTFKRDVLNKLFKKYEVKSILDIGCGDGNQLRELDLSNISYTGCDISEDALAQCRKEYPHYSFMNLKDLKDFSSDCILSLDVIYHLIENEVYYDYLNLLFNSSKKMVIIYSSDTNNTFGIRSRHVKNRKFTKDVEELFPQFKLKEKIENIYPYNPQSHEGSFCDFFVYERN